MDVFPNSTNFHPKLLPQLTISHKFKHLSSVSTCVFVLFFFLCAVLVSASTPSDSMDEAQEEGEVESSTKTRRSKRATGDDEGKIRQQSCRRTIGIRSAL